MATLDPNQKWRELTETYRRMSDDEICRLAKNTSDLVPIAQEVLQAVIVERGLKVSSAKNDIAETDRHEMDADEEVDPRYLEDTDEYELVSVRKVYSAEEAEMVKSILDANFIACCLGPDEIVELKNFQGSFADGVELKVLQRDSRRASQALDTFAPIPEIEEEKEAEGEEFAIVCPKCHSHEVIFESGNVDEANKNTTGKFNWTCCDCGHKWEDDGIVETV